MSNGNSSLFDILLGQGRSDTDLEGGRDRPVAAFEKCVIGDRHALETGDENPICERLKGHMRD